MEPITVTKQVTIEDGKHEGVIISVDPRTFKKGDEEIRYADILIENPNFRIKASYSANISEQSMLGKLLMRFGVKLIEGQKIDPTAELLSKNVSFQTSTNEKTGYSDVLRETLKPKE